MDQNMAQGLQGMGQSVSSVASPYYYGWTVPTYTPPLPERHRLALEVLSCKGAPQSLKSRAAKVLAEALS